MLGRIAEHRVRPTALRANDDWKSGSYAEASSRAAQPNPPVEDSALQERSSSAGSSRVRSLTSLALLGRLATNAYYVASTSPTEDTTSVGEGQRSSIIPRHVRKGLGVNGMIACHHDPPAPPKLSWVDAWMRSARPPSSLDSRSFDAATVGIGRLSRPGEWAWCSMADVAAVADL